MTHGEHHADDPEILAAKINSETAIVEWKELEVLFARGKVFVVDDSLDLVKTALAVTNDDKKLVESYMNKRQLFQPDINWVKNTCKPTTPFWASVVAPFVFIQKQGES
ncbi:DUF2288 family protein [Pleionea sediminis]|uniref:DUF2288 family protein n=1 Tax=Pleionea sediminis TaxID=2569479 RepID=UPI0013DDAF57|nr:DUF2288 family protein [Pleionea sediminis]